MMKQELIKQIKSLINQPNIDENEVIFQLRNLLYENEFEKIKPSDSLSLSELFSTKINEIENPHEQQNFIKTGFYYLDRITNGLSPGELVVVGGRPSMGKTQFLVNLSLKISETFPVLFFTYDLSVNMLTNRYISILTEINRERLNRDLEFYEKQAIIERLKNKLNTYKIFINDGYNNTISSLRAHCQKQIEENHIKVIFIDYLQLMSHPRFRHNRELEISYLSRELKNIAREFNVCVIVTSQLSRECERRPGQKRPILSDLRDSGAIEQDADKVIFLYRPAYYRIEEDEMGNSTARLIELIVAKNRNGYTGEAKLKHSSDFNVLEDYTNDEIEFTFDKNRLDEIITPPF